jgi:hypothetical protein
MAKFIYEHEKYNNKNQSDGESQATKLNEVNRINRCRWLFYQTKVFKITNKLPILYRVKKFFSFTTIADILDV